MEGVDTMKEFTEDLMDKIQLPFGMYKVIQFKEKLMDSVIVELEHLGTVILSNWNGSEWCTVHDAKNGEALDLILRPRCWAKIDGEIYSRDYAIYFYCK